MHGGYSGYVAILPYASLVSVTAIVAVGPAPYLRHHPGCQLFGAETGDAKDRNGSMSTVTQRTCFLVCPYGKTHERNPCDLNYAQLGAVDAPIEQHRRQQIAKLQRRDLAECEPCHASKTDRAGQAGIAG